MKYLAKLKQIKDEYFIISILVIIKLILLLVADMNSGFDGDEVLYIDAGRHPAWGYMEAPPMIGFLAWILNLFHSQSIFVYHLFVHIASALIIIFCGLIIIQLGGKWRALILSLSCVLLVPAFGITHNAFQPVILDQLFWVFCFYFLIRYIKVRQNKYLILLSLAAALGFLSKYSIFFFISGLILAIIIFEPLLFKKRIFWISSLLFILIISPNVYWQISNGFPVFDHFSALYKLIGGNTIADSMKMLVLSMNPLTIFLWITGIFILPFLKYFRSYRVYFYTILFSFILLVFSKGRFYYLYPVALMALCTGSVFLEYYLSAKKWILNVYVSFLILTGAAMLPIGLPVMPLGEYIKYLSLKEDKNGRIPIQFEARYTKEVWYRLTEEVNKAYQQLLPVERENSLIWASDYTQAGVINFFGKTQGLPQAFSFLSSYYLWVPVFDKNISMITIHNSNQKHDSQKWITYYKKYFNKVEIAGLVFSPYSRQDNNAYYYVFICRELKYNSSELKHLFKEHIFD